MGHDQTAPRLAFLASPSADAQDAMAGLVARHGQHEPEAADVLVVLGTSLVVYPAAGLIRYFKGKHLVLINRTATSYDSQADLHIQDSFANVFPKIHI